MAVCKHNKYARHVCLAFAYYKHPDQGSNVCHVVALKMPNFKNNIEAIWDEAKVEDKSGSMRTRPEAKINKELLATS